MRFEFIVPGKTRDGYIQKGIDDFSKRLGHYATFSLTIVKEEKGRKNEQQLKVDQGRKLLSRVSADKWLVALDPAGPQCSSEELAATIGRWQDQGRQKVSFVIGGHLGLSREVLAAADQVLSLSKMTFTHDMARLIMLEQLYRAMTIRAGGKYHK